MNRQLRNDIAGGTAATVGVFIGILTCLSLGLLAMTGRWPW